ncbi:MAG: Protein abhd16a, partial [Paramarteilia canceri]
TGRSSNPVYMDFFVKYSKNTSKAKLAGYEYDLRYQKSYFKLEKPESMVKTMNGGYNIFTRLVSRFIVNNIAVLLAYPGSNNIFKSAHGSIILEAHLHRKKRFNFQEFVIEVSKEIRLSCFYYSYQKGIKASKIIVYFTGNGEYAEYSPKPDELLGFGHDLIMFNRPGYGMSTGKPIPLNEMNSVKAIMEFVVNNLGYNQKSVILYGWSIGGFSASIASHLYPDVYGIIVDASFDSITEMAKKLFPDLLHPIIECACGKYFPVSPILYFFPPSLIPSNFVVVIRTEDRIMGDPTSENSTELLKTSRTSILALKMIAIKYKDQLKSSQDHMYLKETLTDEAKFLRRTLSRNPNQLDLYVQRHVMMAKVQHDTSLGQKFSSLILEKIEENGKYSSRFNL